MIELKPESLFASCHEEQEVSTPLFGAAGVKIERMVSHGQPSPTGFWYNQPDDEWVLLARGTATLEVEGQSAVELKGGDYVLIPALVRHRVDEVSSDAVWLAVHVSQERRG